MKTPNKGRSGSPRKPNIGRGGNRRFRPDGTPLDSDGRPSRGGQRRNTTESRSSDGEARSSRGGPRPYRGGGASSEGDRRGAPSGPRPYRSDGPSGEGDRRGGPGGSRPYRNDGPSGDGDRRGAPGGSRPYRNDGPSSEGDRRGAPGGSRPYRNDGPSGDGDRRGGPGGSRPYRNDGPSGDGDRRGGPGGSRPYRNDGPSSEGDRRGGPGGSRPYRNDGPYGESDRRSGQLGPRKFRSEGDSQPGGYRGAPRGRGPQQDDDAPQGARPARQRTASLQVHGDLLYGRNAVRESLRAGKRTHRRLFIADGVREDDRINETIELAKSLEVLLERVPRIMLDDLTKGGNHQGVALESSEFPYVELEEIIAAEGTILIMDHLNDPQNFGTLMRAADASGIAGIVLPNDRSVSVTPAVVNSSAGAVEHLRVAQTPNLARALDKIEESGRWIVGLDEDETATNIYTTTVPTPVALVLGAEGSGISPIVRKRCQVVLSLPMRGHVDSLNAATAGSIVLYDLLRRELTED